MTGGGFSTSVPPAGVEFEAKITPIVIISCIMAATGGLMFGYDVGVSGNFIIFLFNYVIVEKMIIDLMKHLLLVVVLEKVLFFFLKKKKELL